MTVSEKQTELTFSHLRVLCLPPQISTATLNFPENFPSLPLTSLHKDSITNSIIHCFCKPLPLHIESWGFMISFDTFPAAIHIIIHSTLVVSSRTSPLCPSILLVHCGLMPTSTNTITLKETTTRHCRISQSFSIIYDHYAGSVSKYSLMGEPTITRDLRTNAVRVI